MTEDLRKARLAELELAASNPWCDDQTQLEYAIALSEETDRQYEALQAQHSPMKRKAKATPIDAAKYRPRFRIGRSLDGSSQGYDPLEFIEISNSGFIDLVADEMGRAVGEIRDEIRAEMRREFAQLSARIEKKINNAS
jgi:hypothetical protein